MITKSPMRCFFAACVCSLLLVAPAFGQWKLTALIAMGPENHPDALPTDLWLKIELKNDSKETLYVPGLWGKWYMVESFIRDAEGLVWQRQNVGVGQELVMTPVAPGATISAGGRYSREHVGRLILLTFVVARSQDDKTGSRVLVGPFTIPAPGEAKAPAEPKKN